MRVSVESKHKFLTAPHHASSSIHLSSAVSGVSLPAACAAEEMASHPQPIPDSPFSYTEVDDDDLSYAFPWHLDH